MASPRMVLFLFLRQSTCVALFGLIWPYMVFYGRILSFLAVIDSNSFRFCCLIISCISSTFSFQGELLAFFDWVTWPLVWWQPGSLKSSSKRTKMILMPMQLLLKKLCQRNPTRKKPKLYRIKTAAKNPNEKRLESNLSFLQKRTLNVCCHDHYQKTSHSSRILIENKKKPRARNARGLKHCCWNHHLWKKPTAESPHFY